MRPTCERRAVSSSEVCDPTGTTAVGGGLAAVDTGTGETAGAGAVVVCAAGVGVMVATGAVALEVLTGLERVEVPGGGVALITGVAGGLVGTGTGVKGGAGGGEALGELVELAAGSFPAKVKR